MALNVFVLKPLMCPPYAKPVTGDVPTTAVIGALGTGVAAPLDELDDVLPLLATTPLLGGASTNGVSTVMIGKPVNCVRLIATPPLLTQPTVPLGMMPRTQFPLLSRPSSKMVVPRATPVRRENVVPGPLRMLIVVVVEVSKPPPLLAADAPPPLAGTGVAAAGAEGAVLLSAEVGGALNVNGVSTQICGSANTCSPVTFK
jgi:hypothetical protein